MALKLRRLTRRFTNGSLSPRNSRSQPDPLGTGAASFKRVLGGGPGTKVDSFPSPRFLLNLDCSDGETDAGSQRCGTEVGPALFFSTRYGGQNDHTFTEEDPG